MPKQRPLRIYIAGPFTAPTPAAEAANVLRAIDAGLAVAGKGHFPFVPHTSYWFQQQAVRTGHPGFSWDWYLRWGRFWLETCDALLYLAPSKGADLERTWAYEGGLRVFDSVAQVPEVTL